MTRPAAPFLLSSSVVANNYEMCARAFDMGWAGIPHKTMCTMEIHETSPRFSALKDGSGAVHGSKNIEQLSSHSMEEDLRVLVCPREAISPGGRRMSTVKKF